MHRWMIAALLMLLSLVGGTANALEKSDIGVVVLHGKWDSPDGHVSGLADYLRREGFRVTRPEMPWSGRRGYDQGADGMVSEIDRAVEELRKAGARKIYVAGHSQGAAGALYYAGRQPVNGIVLIATGGHAQGKVFVPHYASYVTEAKNRIAQGKGAERMSFVDLNTGGRTRRIDAPAQSVADYFDTEGPFNTYLSAARVKPDTAVLVLIPRQETEGLKRLANQIKDKVPEGARAETREIDADHLHAPDASKTAIRDWLLAP